MLFRSLSERLKAGTEFKRLKKGHRPAPMPLKQTHILSYKPQIPGRSFRRTLHKRKGPLCRGPSQFKVAGKGIASARCADGPLRRLRALRAALANAYAFTQLRALTGFDSMWELHKR